MTPRFAQAVDPIFLHVLRLLDRIADEPVVAQEEQLLICTLLDEAEARLGAGVEWELAKYALASWIDELLVDADWPGRDWWSNNVLEVRLFNTRLCNERFYVRAQEASALARRDALEVYYNCVVLGFRGLYRDPNVAAVLTPSRGLPPTLEAWARQTAMGIRLGQGRPPFAAPRREIRGAPPLRTKVQVAWSWTMALLLVLGNFAVFYALFWTGR